MFVQILSAVRDWLSRVDLPSEILYDRGDALRVIFETEHALGELLVAEAEFAPFRFVSFTVLDTRAEPTAAPLFCFCDDESCTVADILRELECGTECISNLT